MELFLLMSEAVLVCWVDLRLRFWLPETADVFSRFEELSLLCCFRISRVVSEMPFEACKFAMCCL